MYRAAEATKAVEAVMPRRLWILLSIAVLAAALQGCRGLDRSPGEERPTDAAKVPPTWALYRTLALSGATDAELDRGYYRTDYINRKRSRVRAGDGMIEKKEVLEYALENYQKYRDAIRADLDMEVPWMLDDLNPETSFDALLRNKVGRTLRAIDRRLAAAGYRRGDGRYDELTAVSLYAFALASARGTRPAAAIPRKVAIELGEARLDGVLSFVQEEGGLGRADVREDCRLESNALKALEMRCGRCSEDSKILYALFRMAGLDAHFVYGRIDYQSLEDPDLAPGFLHFSVTLRAPGGRRRIFDLANRNSSAEPLYERELGWWFVGTNREILSLHYAGLCIQHVKISEPDNAIVACEKALQLDPDSFVALTNLGAAYAKKRFYWQASQLYRRALAIEPGSAEAHYDLGGVYYAAGEERRALQSLDRALELYPDFADAHNALGAIYLERGELDQAARHFGRARRIRPDPLFEYNLELIRRRRNR